MKKNELNKLSLKKFKISRLNDIKSRKILGGNNSDNESQTKTILQELSFLNCPPPPPPPPQQ